MSTLSYTRWVAGAKVQNEARIGDRVRQVSYGRGLGRLEDCGRVGRVMAVNRTKVVVDFGLQIGRRPVSPDVLALVARFPEVMAECLAGA